MELQLYREYKDIAAQFSYVVETERRFYLTNDVDLQPRNADGEVYFELTMRDAWVWDMYRPARFVKTVRVVTFKDVNIEELDKPELELPDGKAGFDPLSLSSRRPQARLLVHRRRLHPARPTVDRRRRCGGMASQGRGRAVRRGRRRPASDRAGLTILDRNWRCRAGELDIVAVDGRRAGVLRGQDPLVDGVRRPGRGGDPGQGARIRRLALAWLAARRESGEAEFWAELRFDVVSVLRQRHGAALGRAPARGVLMAVARDARAVVAVAAGVTAQSSRSRPTCPPACPGSLHRPGRHLGGRVARPDPGRRGQLRHRLAEPADHVGAAAGRRPQDRLALRPRAGAGRARPRPGSIECASVRRRGLARRARARRRAAAGARGAAVGAWRPGRPGSGGSSSPGPTAPRRHWCDGVDVRVADDLRQVVAWLRGDGPALPDGRARHGDGRRAAGPDLADVSGQGTAKRGARGRRGGRPPPVPPRRAGCRQDDAGRAAARPAAAARRRGRARGHRGALGRRAAGRGRRAASAAAVAGAAPHGLGGRPGRRRIRAGPAGRDLASPTTACCSSTRPPSSARTSSTRCGSRWRAAR